MSDFNEAENAKRIESLNADLAKSDLPYHTAETEKIQAEREAGEPEQEVDQA